MSYRVMQLSGTQRREELLQMWADTLSDQRIAAALPERYRWLYDDNPVGPTQTWLGVHVESNRVIGCGSMIPRRLHLGDVPELHVRAGMLSDLAVIPNHRTAGPALKILRATAQGSLDGGKQVLFGWPNAKSTPIFKRLRFNLVGDSREWVKVLRAESLLQRRIPAGAWSKAAAVIVDSGLAAYDYSTRLADRRRFRTEIGSSADASFDELWRRAPHPWITGEKTSTTLNWRYGQCRTADYSFLRVYAEPDQTTLLGFVVFTNKSGVASVADLFCDYDRDAELLLFAFSQRMRREGYKSIRMGYVGNDFFDRALRAQRFFLRHVPRPLYARVDRQLSPAVQERLLDEQHWCMFTGDLDI